MASVENARRIAFGRFEVDLLTGELWKAGFRVRLQEQPFKVLAALLARPGEVVTRTELQAHVWGPNTNVDFERSLAVAIKKVREALGDSAENPRFVETLAKRGYRFIAPIATAPPVSAKQSVLESPPDNAVQLFPFTETGLESAYPLAAPSVRPAFPRWFGQAWSPRELTFAGLAALLAGLLLALASRHPAIQAPVRVLQLTRDSVFSSGPPNIENPLTLVSEGDRILGPMLIDGRPRLASLDLSTSEVKPLTIPEELASATLCDISRDGARLLLRGHLSSQSEQPLWVAPTAGGSAMRLGNVLAHAATWTPDGTSILIASGNELELVQSDSGILTPFLKLPGRAFSPRWSPDGKLLRFTLMDPSTHVASIWEAQSGSRAAHPLHSRADGKFECCGTWTADGQAYVFQASDNFSSDLWEIETVRGAVPQQLTNGPLPYAAPAAARPGRRIFFFGADPPFGLQQYTGGPVGFRSAPAFLTEANRVAYSRDGQWVAWTDPVGKLWRARAADGSERVQLTPNSLDVFLAQWSPDASRLVAMARAPGEAWQIYLIDRAGGSPERLFKDQRSGKRNAADPTWSPDGRRIVYGREPDTMGKDSEPHTLAIYDLQGSKTEILPSSQGLFSPRWSPDGKWIAALTLDQKEVMLFNVAAQAWTELASTSAADPAWSSDSQALYIHAFMADKQPILRISVPGGKVQRIADAADFHSGAPANYFFGGLSPANAPLVQPRVGTGNLYSLDLTRRP